jgi:hypothetical protein
MVEWSGLKVARLKATAKVSRIPVGNKTVDLPTVIRKLVEYVDRQERLRWVRTERELAVVLGVSPPSLERYLARGMPGRAPRGFEVGKCREWFGRYLEELRTTTENKRNVGLEAARIRQAEAAAALTELELEERQGLLVSLEAVKDRDRASIVAAKQGLLEMCRGAATDLIAQGDERRIETILLRHVTAILTRFATQRNTEQLSRRDGKSKK